LLKPLSTEIFIELSRTVEFYIYAILINFTSEQFRKLLFSEVSLLGLKEDETKMQNLEQLHEIFLFQTQYKSIRTFVARILDYFENFKTEFQFQKKLMSNPSNNMLYDLAERATSTESIFFIYDHLKYIQYRVTKIIGNWDQQGLSVVMNTYEMFGKILPEIRHFVYECMMPNLLRNDNFFQNIPNVKWEVNTNNPVSKELTNIYTERVVYFIKEFKEKVKCLAGGIIPEHVQQDLLREVIIFTFKQLMDSYSKIKKFNLNGRQMMYTDFEQIIQRLNEFVEMKPIPYQEFVESFILLWMKNPQEVTEFIIKNKANYSLRQLNTVFNTNVFVLNLKKPQRKELTNQIEAEYIEFLKKG